MAAVAMPGRAEGTVSHRQRRGRSKPRRPRRPKRDGLPVHLLDIHLEKGMHCVDCHFVQDVHGNTKLQRRGPRGHRDPVHRLPRHGRPSAPTLLTSGPASDTSGRPTGRPRPGGAAHALRPAPVRAAGRQDLSRTRWSSTNLRLGNRPDRRHDRPDQRALQRQVGALAKTVRFAADGPDRSGATCPDGKKRLRPRRTAR